MALAFSAGGEVSIYRSGKRTWHGSVSPELLKALAAYLPGKVTASGSYEVRVPLKAAPVGTLTVAGSLP